MFIDSQDVERSYDVVVAGAGPAGLVFAREYLRLSSDKARVLIIESGDTFDLQSQAQKLSRHQATGDLDSDYYPLHNQRVVGG
ncbi:MAG: flavin-dependent dehydrogenase, partial [Arenicella sp.]